MEINKALELVNKLATPNDVESVHVDQYGQIELFTKHGNLVSDTTLKELDAVIFKESHQQAPRKWRSWVSSGKKEF